LYRAATGANSSGIMPGMGKIPGGVKRVFFDAVGTLLFPEPAVAVAYHQAGQRFGSQLSLEDVTRRFQQAFAAQEALDRELEYRTDEEREVQRWRAIVAEALPDVSDREGCFVHLWEHFASPRTWRAVGGLGELFTTLRARGLELGIASNFDRRLIGVVRHLPNLAELPVVVSSLLGWRKPARGFFQSLVGWDEQPHEILHVGDDPENDYRGARDAGLHALLIDANTQLSDLL
jgi:putative hydrolase of the HAD superfamily